MVRGELKDNFKTRKIQAVPIVYQNKAGVCDHLSSHCCPAGFGNILIAGPCVAPTHCASIALQTHHKWPFFSFFPALLSNFLTQKNSPEGYSGRSELISECFQCGFTLTACFKGCQRAIIRPQTDGFTAVVPEPSSLLGVKQTFTVQVSDV